MFFWLHISSSNRYHYSIRSVWVRAVEAPQASAIWWSHSRHVWEPCQLYGPDGVHFSNTKPYYKSVRGAVLKSVDLALSLRNADDRNIYV